MWTWNYTLLGEWPSSALPQVTVPRPTWALGLWRTTFLAPRHSYFWQKWKCMHYRHNEFQNFVQNLALDAHDALHRKSTLAFIRHSRGFGGGGGGDKLAIDKGGNLPEKVENHWSNIIHQMSRSPTQALAEYQITTGTIDPPGGATDTALRSTEVPKTLFTTILILPKLFICKLL